MKEWKLEYKTVSHIILSPRIEKALYKGIDFKCIKNPENIEILYPMYCRENRGGASEKVFSKANGYYIPASSLKGALLSGARNNNVSKLHDDAAEKYKRNGMIFEDLDVCPSKIAIRSLFKFQYLYQNQKSDSEEDSGYKTPKLLRFFPSVAVEMIRNDVAFSGNVMIKSDDGCFDKLLRDTFDLTRSKLKNYCQEIVARKKVVQSWKKDAERFKKTLDELECILESINVLMDSPKRLFFLGGFKGLISCLSDASNPGVLPNTQNGFYIDPETYLPYGLVEVSEIKIV